MVFVFHFIFLHELMPQYPKTIPSRFPSGIAVITWPPPKAAVF
jgi:hypothetical protein